MDRFALVSISRALSLALTALIAYATFSPLLPSSAASAQSLSPSLAARASLAPVKVPPSTLVLAPVPMRSLLGDGESTITQADDSTEKSATHFKTRFVLGFVSSILAHEAGHVMASYAVGGHPSFGLDKGRPTVYSGIDADLEPHKQFIFSSAGLTVQTLMDELILDVPHQRGGAFERGLLAGGIATTAFYITIGRNASVSDVTFMARTSSLSKTQVSLIFGGIAAMHAVRIHFDDHYAHFFAAPTERRGLKVGVVVRD